MRRVFDWIFITILLSVSTTAEAQFSYNSERLSEISWTPKSIEVKGVKRSEISLNGEWDFFYKDITSIDNLWSESCSDKITVPGEWVMQGYTVDAERGAYLRHNFNIPKRWSSSVVKLQFEAVYSDCKILLNGEVVGEHHNGFTPFEVDITESVKSGDNTLIVHVVSSGAANKLSSGSQYAMHDLGGISRDVTVIATPKTYIKSFHASTFFDDDYVDGELIIHSIVDNRASEDRVVKLSYTLLDRDSREVAKGEALASAKQGANDVITTIPVEAPNQWNPESPYLYTLKLATTIDGEEQQLLSKRVGFREIEVRGNEVYVNNRVVKLRGACRHEVHPLTGRVLSGDAWYRDVELFKQANMNYIRTSHYPPSEKLIEACDELGMFVEVEAPYCWANKSHVTEENYFDQIIRPAQDMVEQLKSHPSIIIWSAANESYDYDLLFKESARVIAEADSTRLRIFSQYGPEVDGGSLEICNHHYPGPQGIDMYRNYSRPIIFDEYLHLNAYNRKELASDPAVRDFWGTLLNDMWSKMYRTKGILGGAIWAGIDDTFILPGDIPVGYGTWGPVDGWRRAKPEYYHVKKAYSPVKLSWNSLDSRELKLNVENQYLFTNLSSIEIRWSAGGDSGVIKPDVECGAVDTISIPVTDATEEISIDLFDPIANYSVDSYRYSVGNGFDLKREVNSKGGISIKEQSGAVTITDSDINVEIDSNRALFKLSKGNFIYSNEIPKLSLVPLTGEGGGTQMTKRTPQFRTYSPACENRQIESIVVTDGDDGVVIEIRESYLEAIGSQTWRLTEGGRISIEFNYTMLKGVSPRQIGMQFKLDNSFDSIEWSRKGYWSCYPESHIGRLEGSAVKFNDTPKCGLAGPISEPNYNYCDDQTESGTNDFRSTKRNLLSYSISAKGDRAIALSATGNQHSRAWYSEGNVYWMVAIYDNPGAERFLRYSGRENHVSKYDRDLKYGDKIEGVIDIKLK